MQQVCRGGSTQSALCLVLRAEHLSRHASACVVQYLYENERCADALAAVLCCVCCSIKAGNERRLDTKKKDAKKKTERRRKDFD